MRGIGAVKSTPKKTGEIIKTAANTARVTMENPRMRELSLEYASKLGGTHSPGVVLKTAQLYYAFLTGQS